MSTLEISHAVLWLVVAALCLVVFALMRQIGVLHERVFPAGALVSPRGPRPGEPSPVAQLTAFDDRAIRLGDGFRSTLLLFVSPTCPVCKTLLPVLRSASKSEAGWLDIVLASDGETQEQLRFVERESLHAFPYVVSRSLGMSYRVGKLPYAYLIDDQGVLRTGGLVNSREHLESLFNAKELSVASVQDYLRREQAAEKHVA